ncbi:DinB family protein [Bacillus sp. FJAT-47783]|uniref:DinB family protein n=1 Tax=Bacillus sp. FJAT-47783 TaxID=2922712 RepID=UPI001FAD9A32|nr:DinB family protein [Bacillus sp. FJAT-47783]
MDINTLLNHYRFVRTNTLSILKDVTEEASDLIPEGHNNSIRWNAGHILVSEALFFGAILDNPKSQQYVNLFKPGTNPREYESMPPSLEEINDLLQSQQSQLEKMIETRANEPLPKAVQIGPVELKTIKDVVHFSIYHEGVHQGTMKALINSISK